MSSAHCTSNDRGSHRRCCSSTARASGYPPARSEREGEHERRLAVVHYERLALDYSAMRVCALQDEDLLERALEALDRIAEAADGAAAELRAVAFGAAVELRALLDARSERQNGEDP